MHQRGGKATEGRKHAGLEQPEVGLGRSQKQTKGGEELVSSSTPSGDAGLWGLRSVSATMLHEPTPVVIRSCGWCGEPRRFRTRHTGGSGPGDA